MNCPTSINVICKHVRDRKTYYVDLNLYLPEGVTVSNPEADTDTETSLTIVDASVVEADTVLEESSTCHGATLYEGRAILLTLSGGVTSDEEVIVTVSWTQSDGDTGSVDCRLFVSGRAAP